MLELLYQAIEPVNIIFTFFLFLSLLYWLSIIVGAINFGDFETDLDIDTDVDVDVDADIDVDVDVDADIDVDADLDADTGGATFAEVLHFFNFGKLPFMVILTVLFLCMWVLSILGNFYIGHGSYGMALLLLFPNLFISLVITKIVTAPLIPLFKRMGEGSEAVRYIGKQCKIILPPTTKVVGQGEVKLNGNVLLINIKLIEDGETLKKGDKATVLEQVKDKKIFLVDKI